MNRELEYTYAVARVRANEQTLLSAADIEQLITAGDYKVTMQKLSDAGWGEIKDIYNYASYIENYFAKTWNFLVEIMSDIHELDLLLVKNDMQNLKAALKQIVSQHDAKDLYVQSTVYDTETILKAVEERMIFLTSCKSQQRKHMKCLLKHQMASLQMLLLIKQLLKELSSLA